MFTASRSEEDSREKLNDQHDCLVQLHQVILESSDIEQLLRLKRLALLNDGERVREELAVFTQQTTVSHGKLKLDQTRSEYKLCSIFKMMNG